MPIHDRRTFLGTSLGGLATLGAAPGLMAVQPAGTGPRFEPDTLFLTWQRDPTTTMTVQWIAPAVAPDSVAISYAPMADGLLRAVKPTLRPYPMTDLHTFRAELTGLTPGTEYRFQIGTNSPTYRFRTMPSKATNTFQFVSGGDCGVGSAAVANNALAARQDPMFALIGGDLGYDNGRSAKTSIDFIKNYSQHMIDSEGRLIPMVVCIGNHEVDGAYGQPREKGPFYFALFDGLYSERSYATLDFGDYLSLVLLDTGHVARIDGEQTDWLDRTLAERTDRPHLIVVNHVPAYPSYRPYGEGPDGKGGTGELNRKHWVPLFQKHNVDLVLEHHDHTFKRTHPLTDNSIDPNGIVYLGDGSWGKLRPVKDPEKRPYLATAESAYHLTVHRLEGGQRYHTALAEGGRVADVCVTAKRPKRNGARVN